MHYEVDERDDEREAQLDAEGLPLREPAAHRRRAQLTLASAISHPVITIKFHHY